MLVVFSEHKYNPTHKALIKISYERGKRQGYAMGQNQCSEVEKMAQLVLVMQDQRNSGPGGPSTFDGDLAVAPHIHMFFMSGSPGSFCPGPFTCHPKVDRVSTL